MRKAIFVYIVGIGATLAAFQNCSKAGFASGSSVTGGLNFDLSKPFLAVTADPEVVNKGSSTTINAVINLLDVVDYACTPPGASTVITRGQLTSDKASFRMAVERDLHCVFTGTGTKAVTPLVATIDLTVQCGAGVKNAAGACEDFSCKSVVTLSANALTIPARTSAGICYALKIVDGLAVSPSTLTTVKDTSVVARSHDAAPLNGTAQNPYLMGQSNLQFLLRGPRVVKLAGGADAAAPILVDNFILTGIFPAGSTPDVTKAYRVRGTADATLKDGDDVTDSILFGNVPLLVEAFATGGTSSIAPIDISAFATPNVTQQLDVRALDCGGSRSLSDIYLLFQ